MSGPPAPRRWRRRLRLIAVIGFVLATAGLLYLAETRPAYSAQPKDAVIVSYSYHDADWTFGCCCCFLIFGFGFAVGRSS